MPSHSPARPLAVRPPLLRFLTLAALAVLAMALAYLTRYSLRGEGEVRWFAPDAPCALHNEACTARLGSAGDLSFAIGVEGRIPALQPLPLAVRLSGEAESVVVEFVGRDMEMGLHRFPLVRGADGVFRGDGQVTLCSEAAMPWRAKVMVSTPSGWVGSRFDFDVERGGK